MFPRGALFSSSSTSIQLPRCSFYIWNGLKNYWTFQSRNTGNTICRLWARFLDHIRIGVSSDIPIPFCVTQYSLFVFPNTRQNSWKSSSNNSSTRFLHLSFFFKLLENWIKIFFFFINFYQWQCLLLFD